MPNCPHCGKPIVFMKNIMTIEQASNLGENGIRRDMELKVILDTYACPVCTTVLFTGADAAKKFINNISAADTGISEEVIDEQTARLVKPIPAPKVIHKKSLEPIEGTVKPFTKGKRVRPSGVL